MANYIPGTIIDREDGIAWELNRQVELGLCEEFVDIRMFGADADLCGETAEFVVLGKYGMETQFCREHAEAELDGYELP